eukprot:2791511-Pleurochrysis_carterae.AAC.8
MVCLLASAQLTSHAFCESSARQHAASRARPTFTGFVLQRVVVAAGGVGGQGNGEVWRRSRSDVRARSDVPARQEQRPCALPSPVQMSHCRRVLCTSCEQSLSPYLKPCSL